MPRNPWPAQTPPVNAGDSSLVQIHHGVVSPCSTCKNKRAATENGKPFCPRLYWAMMAAAGADGPEYLLYTGTDDKTLANPVYDKENKVILIWVATLENNQPLVDPVTGQLSSGLLDGDFDTDRILCQMYPYLAGQSEAEMYSAGAYLEGQQLAVTSSPIYQISPLGIHQPFGGTVNRIKLMGQNSFLTAKKDVIASGS